MADILIDTGSFNNALRIINMGFWPGLYGSTLRYNASPKSNFPSMIALTDYFVKMDSLLKSYDTFLKNDVKEFKKIGEKFVEIDQAYKNALGGP